MARKKSFEEYREENLREQEKIKQQIEDARLKQLQAEHCIQRAENQIAYQRKKKDKARVHRLITKGAAIEAICKDTQYLMESEFYELMDEVLHIPELQFHLRVADMVQGRQGIVEEEQLGMLSFFVSAAIRRTWTVSNQLMNRKSFKIITYDNKML